MRDSLNIMHSAETQGKGVCCQPWWASKNESALLVGAPPVAGL